MLRYPGGIHIVDKANNTIPSGDLSRVLRACPYGTTLFLRDLWPAADLVGGELQVTSNGSTASNPDRSHWLIVPMRSNDTVNIIQRIRQGANTLSAGNWAFNLEYYPIEYVDGDTVIFGQTANGGGLNSVLANLGNPSANNWSNPVTNSLSGTIQASAIRLQLWWQSSPAGPETRGIRDLNITIGGS